jgi:hypothetical protein
MWPGGVKRIAITRSGARSGSRERWRVVRGTVARVVMVEGEGVRPAGDRAPGSGSAISVETRGLMEAGWIVALS